MMESNQTTLEAYNKSKPPGHGTSGCPHSLT